MTDRIAVGVIRKAHGLRGEASVEPWTDSPERFEELDAVTLASPDDSQTRETRVETVRMHAGRALVKFAGIETPEAVQLVQGWSVEIPEKEARALDKDEYFLHDLPGLTLIDPQGRDRGVVTEVLEGGGGVLLGITRPDGRRYELPFAADICTEIDLSAKRILVAIPEGLEDLNAIKE